MGVGAVAGFWNATVGVVYSVGFWNGTVGVVYAVGSWNGTAAVEVQRFPGARANLSAS